MTFRLYAAGSDDLGHVYGAQADSDATREGNSCVKCVGP